MYFEELWEKQKRDLIISSNSVERNVEIYLENYLEDDIRSCYPSEFYASIQKSRNFWRFTRIYKTNEQLMELKTVWMRFGYILKFDRDYLGLYYSLTVDPRYKFRQRQEFLEESMWNPKTELGAKYIRIRVDRDLADYKKAISKIGSTG